MNWIPIQGEDAPSPLPPGWHDVWLALRPDEQGWTFDTNICPQKGRRYKNGVRGLRSAPTRVPGMVARCAGGTHQPQRACLIVLILSYSWLA